MKQTIVNALKAQLRRLENDKKSPEFVHADLFFVVMINDEIAKIKSLLQSAHLWDITTRHEVKCGQENSRRR